MPGDDARLFVVPGGIASKLKNLSGQILHHSCHVDWSSSSYPLGIISLPDENWINHKVESKTLPEKPMDPANRELEACPAGPGLCLSLHLATLSTARHLVYELKF